MVERPSVRLGRHSPSIRLLGQREETWDHGRRRMGLHWVMVTTVKMELT
jgi:hypothetical protein